MRQLTILTAVILAAQLVSGTLVTAACPHAGDKSADRVVPRLEVEITTLVHVHTSLLVAYLLSLVALGLGLKAVHAPRPVWLRLGVLSVLVLAQGLVGTVQFYNGGVLLGTATIASGSATFTTTAFAAGSHAITVRYLGSASAPPVISGELRPYLPELAELAAHAGLPDLAADVRLARQAIARDELVLALIARLQREADLPLALLPRLAPHELGLAGLQRLGRAALTALPTPSSPVRWDIQEHA